MDPSQIPILVVGTGALGCLYAARLASASVPVAMYGSWQEGLQALREHGVRLVDASGTERVYPVRVLSSPQECYEALYAIVLVKSWQTEKAAQRLETCLADEGMAVSLQNGFGNREILENTLGAQRVSLGVTTVGATLLGPGKVRPGGSGVITLEDDPRLDTLVHLLKTAEFSVNIVPDANAILWGKLVINAAINPLSALLDIPNGALLERPAARQLMSQAASEAASVANAMGVQLPYRDPTTAVEEIVARTAANYSSMLQDIRRGAPTEINAISGAIVRFGQQVGVATPVNQLLWQLMNAKEGI